MNLKINAKHLLLTLALVFSFSTALSVRAAPPDSPYEPGETLAPSCSPGATNCSVSTPIYNSSSTIYVDTDNGRVGIGTTTPVAALEILGGPAVTAPFASSVRISDGNIYLPNSSTINFGNAAGTSFQPILTRGNDNFMRLRSGGGATIITGDTSSRILLGVSDIAASAINGGTGAVIFFSSSTSQSAARTSVSIHAHPNQESTDPLFYIQNPTGGNVLHLTTSATTASSTLLIGSNTATTTVNFDSGTLFVDAGNNRVGVGIGTTTPTAPLQVGVNNGVFNVSSVTSSIGLTVNTTSSLSSGGVHFPADFKSVVNDSEQVQLKFGLKNSFSSDYSNNNWFIGYYNPSANTPRSSLELGVGSIGGAGEASYSPFAAISIAEVRKVTINSSTVAITNNADFNADSGTLFVDASANMVGIGTTTPATTLHVVGTSTFMRVISVGTTTPSIDFDFVTPSGIQITGTSSLIAFSNQDSSARFDVGLEHGNNFVIWDHINGISSFVIDPSGNVGIGSFDVLTGSPLAITSTLHVAGSAAMQYAGTVLTVNRLTNDGTIISLQQASTEEGTISVSGNTVSYNAFTGSHYAMTDETIERSMLVSLTGNNGRLGDRDDSEILYGITKSNTANDSKILGSYLSLQEPTKPKDSNNPHLVMAVGNGDLWIVDNGSDIAIGDYLISSDTAGHAMKDPETYAKSYIIARAAEPITWSNESETINGKKHKKISVFFESFVRSGSGVALESRESGLLASLSSFAESIKTNLLEATNILASKIKTKELTIGEKDLPSGFTIYDKDTREPYCMEMRSGRLIPIAGECGDAEIQSVSIPSVTHAPIQVEIQTSQNAQVLEESEAAQIEKSIEETQTEEIISEIKEEATVKEELSTESETPEETSVLE